MKQLCNIDCILCLYIVHIEDYDNPAQLLKNRFKSAKSSPNFHAPEKQGSVASRLEHHTTYAGSLSSNQSSSDLLSRDSSHKVKL